MEFEGHTLKHLKEPVDTVVHNSPPEHTVRQIHSSDDCSDSYWVITVLEQMCQSLGDDEGGVLVCIREAIEHFRNTGHNLPKESDVTSVGSSSELKHCAVTATCQHTFGSILVSEEFASLCKLLLQNFPGIKADSIFHLRLISSGMESGEYEHSPGLFIYDMQTVWDKLLGFGKELIPLSKSLSDMSATCKEESQVQGSVYNTFEGGYNEIFLQEILTVLSEWPAQPHRLVLKLVNFLNLVLEDAEIDLDDEDAKITAFECLTKIDEFLSSSSLDKGTIEALLFQLPKAVALFGGVSDKCMEVAKSILDQFASRFGAERVAVCGQRIKEPVDRVRHNNCHEQVNLQISNSGDCSERDLMIPILKQMYHSIGNDEGGVQVCIREALQHFQDIDHTLPKESSEDVVSDESSKHCTVTATCQHAFVNILVSKEFASLCKLLSQMFPGIKADGIFDLELINSRMKSKVYENSPSVFSVEIQEVWRKLLWVGTELIHLAISLSDMSRTCNEESEVRGSVYFTCGAAYIEIYLQGILTALSQWRYSPRRPVSKLVNFLCLVQEDAGYESDDEYAKDTACNCLNTVDKFLSSSSLGKGTIAELLFRLPKAVALFGGLKSLSCILAAESILNQFATRFDAEMLPAFGKALIDLSERGEDSDYGGIAPLVNGCATAFQYLQQQHFEHIKETTGITLKVLKDAFYNLEFYSEHRRLFAGVMRMATSICHLSMKLEGVVCEKLRALLGFFVLEITAIVSENFEPPTATGYMKELSTFVPSCGLSHIGLKTGSNVDKITQLLNEEDGNSQFNCLSDVELGAVEILKFLESDDEQK